MAVPAFVQPQCPLLRDLMEELKRTVPGAQFLIPDIHPDKDGGIQTEWLLPKGAKSQLHLTSDTASKGELVPWCRRWSGRAFDWGAETGTGIHAANATGRQ